MSKRDWAMSKQIDIKFRNYNRLLVQWHIQRVGCGGCIPTSVYLWQKVVNLRQKVANSWKKGRQINATLGHPPPPGHPIRYHYHHCNHPPPPGNPGSANAESLHDNDCKEESQVSGSAHIHTHLQLRTEASFINGCSSGCSLHCLSCNTNFFHKTKITTIDI